MAKVKKLRVFLTGNEGVNWAIGEDFRQIGELLNNAPTCGIARWPWSAEVVHCIWWNQLLAKRNIWLLWGRKPLIATASNFIALNNPNYADRLDFERLRRHVALWIAPSSKQEALFNSNQVPCVRLPFLINTKLFHPGIRRLNRREIAAQMGLDWNQLDGRLVIGSFQRDSLGSNLAKPKWQKNPEMLIWLLKQMPPDRYVLLLAGPRRHFLIGQCKANRIPYVYVGREMSTDDISKNVIPQEDMPLLYGLTDLYLCTSASEGGPKAILECVASATPIISTDVGLAADYLESQCVPRSREQYAETLRALIHEGSARSIVSETGTTRLIEEMKPAVYQARLEAIYRGVIKTC